MEMFNFNQKETVESGIDELILNCKQRLAQMDATGKTKRQVVNSDGETVEIDMYTEELYKMQRLVNMKRDLMQVAPQKKAIDPNTVLTGMFALGQVGLLLWFEEENILPKCSTFLSKISFGGRN